MGARTSRQLALPEGVRLGVLPVDALLLQAEGDAELSLREGPAVAPLPRRACAAALSQRRGALHRLQAVRGDLPGAGHHHRGGPAPQRRHAAHHPLRHRHGEMHLLRPVPGGLPGRCHRRGARTSSSPPRRARSSTTTRSACWRTATAGSARSPRPSSSTLRTVNVELGVASTGRGQACRRMVRRCGAFFYLFARCHSPWRPASW